jgi:hypothetical protein
LAIPDSHPHLAALLGDSGARSQIGAGQLVYLEDVPADQWGPHLMQLSRTELLRVAIAVVRLALPEWQEKRPEDSVPVKAVSVAERWVNAADSEDAAYARVVAKACTKSRATTLGYEHRFAEAARAIAASVAAKSDSEGIQVYMRPRNEARARLFHVLSEVE